MLKALLVGILLGIILVFAGVWLYFTGGHAPVAVADPPLPFERKLTHSSLHAYMERQKPAESPIPADEKNLLAGADVYKQNCAACHGLPTEPETAIAHGMYPKPPELFHGTGVTDDPVWQTHWLAENGIRMTGMPSFKGRLTDSQLWQVSQLLANADKIPASVRAALATGATATPITSAPAAQNPVPGTK